MAENPATRQPSTSPTGPSSPQDSINNQTQVPTLVGPKSANGYNPMFPFMFPAIIPGLIPHQKDQEQMNRGPGLYAVSVPPYMQSMAGFPPNTLIPFTYNLPTERSTQESGVGAAEQGQPGEVPQPHQQAGIQRQVARRFQIVIQLDLFLILKLTALVFLFNQDGSRQRLAVLIFSASLIYLYQTGALAPVVRWLSRGMQRAVPRPAQPPRPDVRADNLPAAAGAQGNGNAGLAEGQLIGENENHQANDGNRAIENENENAGEPGPGEVGNRWWRLAKEIKLIVFGFITSLLPGFHNID